MVYTNVYDKFGNVTRKESPGLQYPEITTYTYDTSGRYLLSTTDNLGLKTTYTYGTFGTVASITDPFGLTRSIRYDDWQREIESTNYLGKKTSTSYTRLSDGGMRTSVNYPQGSDQITEQNALGWTTSSQSLSLNNKWIKKSFDYDVAGRTTGESESYFSTGSPTQWNKTFYDEYGRLLTIELFTGKITKMEYDGLTVTVDDGTKTVRTTKDQAGNIASVQDPGGTIEYSYYANGSLKEANYGSHKVTTSIDQWGRKTKMEDPSAGTYTYAYNKVGQIISETTPKNGKTTYVYQPNGLLKTRYRSGDGVSRHSTYYSYDSKYRMTKVASLINEKYYAYTYGFDSYNRPNKTTELIMANTTRVNYKHEQTFDDYGRPHIETYTSTNETASAKSVVKVKNQYDSAGILYEIRDNESNAVLWKVNAENQRGQVLSTSLGNGHLQSRNYDAYGQLTAIKDSKIAAGVSTTALHMEYDFDAKRGILKERTNHVFNRTENFSHDNLDRLTTISGAVNQTQSYHNNGSIDTNSEVGKYQYDPSKSMHQLSTVALNSKGATHYTENPLQQIEYDAFKQPIRIAEKNKGYIDFDYGPMKNRTHTYYDPSQKDKYKRNIIKFYSSILPVEMVYDVGANVSNITTYVGGDAYSAPIAHVKQLKGNTVIGTNDYHYIHRDYLGSMLGITRSDGSLLEQNHFGAWGTTDKHEVYGDTLFGKEFFFLGRGFTAHEHLTSVDLIHMNGRMYDAKLRRFLSPDNYIQDPYSTQSFNRYGYVWNNPLVLNDPSGEFIIAALIGAAISVITNGITNSINGRGFFEGAGKAAIFGAIGGAASFGIGEIASGLTSSLTSASGAISAGSKLLVGAFQTGAHALLGGSMSAMQGGKFGAGALAGAAGSLIGAGSSKILGNASRITQIAGGALAGGLAGGVGSAIGGGNFWDGFRNGAIAAGLNHGLHAAQNLFNRIFSNKADAYDHAVDQSEPVGGVEREVSGWSLEDGKHIVLDPIDNKYAQSQNNQLPTKIRNGKLHVRYHGKWRPVKSHFHTHPSTGNYSHGRVGVSGSDLNMLYNRVGGNPTSILYRGNEWIVSPGGNYSNVYKGQSYNYSLNNIGSWR